MQESSAEYNYTYTINICIYIPVQHASINKLHKVCIMSKYASLSLLPTIASQGII